MHELWEDRASNAADICGCLCVDGRIKSDHDESALAEDDARQKAKDGKSGTIEYDEVAELFSDPTSLLRRLHAIDYALKTLPQQAKRLVRIMAQREKAEPGPKRVGPIRPGFPPGYARTSQTPAHQILRECHMLVRDWELGVP